MLRCLYSHLILDVYHTKHRKSKSVAIQRNLMIGLDIKEKIAKLVNWRGQAWHIAYGIH